MNLIVYRVPNKKATTLIDLWAGFPYYSSETEAAQQWDAGGGMQDQRARRDAGGG